MAKKYMAGSLSRLEHHNIPDLPEEKDTHLMSERQGQALIANSIIKLGAEIGKVVGENEANERLMEYSAEMQSKLLSLKEMSASEQKKAYNNGAIDQIYKKHFEAGGKALFGAARQRFQKTLNTNYQTSQIQAYKHILSVAKGEQSDIFDNAKAQLSIQGGQNYANLNYDPDPASKKLSKDMGFTDEQNAELNHAARIAQARNLKTAGNLKGLKIVMAKLPPQDRASFELDFPLMEKNNTANAIRLSTSKSPIDIIRGITHFKQSTLPDNQRFATSIFNVVSQNVKQAIQGKLTTKQMKTVMAARPKGVSEGSVRAIVDTLRYAIDNHPDQIYEGLLGKNWSDLSKEDRRDAGFLVTNRASDEIFNANASGDPILLKQTLAKYKVEEDDLNKILRQSFAHREARARGAQAKLDIRIAKFIMMDTRGLISIPAAELDRMGNKGAFTPLSPTTRTSIIDDLDSDVADRLIHIYGNKGFENLLIIYGAHIRETKGNQLLKSIGTTDYNEELGEHIAKVIDEEFDTLITMAPNKSGWFESDNFEGDEDGRFISTAEWKELEPHEQVAYKMNNEKLTIEWLKKNKHYLSSATRKYLEDADGTTLQKQDDGTYLFLFAFDDDEEGVPIVDSSGRVVSINNRKLINPCLSLFGEENDECKDKKKDKTKPGSGVLARENETFP